MILPFHKYFFDFMENESLTRRHDIMQFNKMPPINFYNFKLFDQSTQPFIQTTIIKMQSRKFHTHSLVIHIIARNQITLAFILYSYYVRKYLNLRTFRQLLSITRVFFMISKKTLPNC